jgi:hypothetical protein
MQIFDQRVFRFVFPFLGQEATFNVVADSQPEAAQKIMDWMLMTMAELSMAFPKVAPEEKLSPIVPAPLQNFAMEALRIDTLVEELSKHLSEGSDLVITIKSWLDMEYKPENYKAIINGLESLKQNYETGKIRKAGR